MSAGPIPQTCRCRLSASSNSPSHISPDWFVRGRKLTPDGTGNYTNIVLAGIGSFSGDTPYLYDDETTQSETFVIEKGSILDLHVQIYGSGTTTKVTGKLRCGNHVPIGCPMDHVQIGAGGNKPFGQSHSDDWNSIDDHCNTNCVNQL